MSDATAIDGVETTDVAAGYVYTLTADSGYRATQTGRISATRHGIVCRALAGKFDDYEQLAEQRAELLEALEQLLDKKDQQAALAQGSTSPYAKGAGSAIEIFAAEVRSAIANATQQRNATGAAS